PMPGVERRMLDRLGDEVARATTIVRYAADSSFSSHVHTGGEEFFVLDGIFQDEHGDFPAGTYIRNPPQSSHTPRSVPGCTIFVKLWQFDPSDRTHVRIDTAKMAWLQDPTRPGTAIMPLFNDGHEDVRLERWGAGQVVEIQDPGGVEILVLDGSFKEADDTFRPHSWLRLPKNRKVEAHAGADGAKVWIKRGHLMRQPQPPAAPV
ncbi:MAG: cupin domain-containing protein, partial [Pseudomonadota bacterium]